VDVLLVADVRQNAFDEIDPRDTITIPHRTGDPPFMGRIWDYRDDERRPGPLPWLALVGLFGLSRRRRAAE